MWATERMCSAKPGPVIQNQKVTFPRSVFWGQATLNWQFCQCAFRVFVAIFP